MAQDELALVKSIEAKDAELVYLCIFHMKSKLTVPELFRIIHDKPLACNLLKLYAEKCDLQLLKDFYYQNDQSSEIAFLELLASFEREVLKFK